MLRLNQPTCTASRLSIDPEPQADDLVCGSGWHGGRASCALPARLPACVHARTPRATDPRIRRGVNHAREARGWPTRRRQSGSCRCAIIGVPWCLRRLSLFSTWLKQCFCQRNHPRPSMLKLTPAMAHLRWHTSKRLSQSAPRVPPGSASTPRGEAGPGHAGAGEGPGGL